MKSTILALLLSATAALSGCVYSDGPIRPYVATSVEYYGGEDAVDSVYWIEPRPGIVIDFADCWHCGYRGGFWYDGRGHRYEPRHERHGTNSHDAHEGYRHHSH